MKAKGSHKNSRRSSSLDHLKGRLEGLRSAVIRPNLHPKSGGQQKLPTIQELLRTGWVKFRIVSDEAEVSSDAIPDVYTSHDEDADVETMEYTPRSNDQLDDDDNNNSFVQSTSISGAPTVRLGTAESVSAAFFDASQHWQFNDMCVRLGLRVQDPQVHQLQPTCHGAVQDVQGQNLMLLYSQQRRLGPKTTKYINFNPLVTELYKVYKVRI